ncbi:hypothetical protein [Luteibacter aegosomatissinici]|uniref:hypothetical protein n=1 Tax=Luteibacter aegosomatissinici TaxID=2911539 RepID=UPI001FF8E561|nr:hypothetical protein [Luteibacter aegosomatissinici]UPG92802.1 hypothetical protein L2Y97_13100 [Luteibacter aegosomatissinici]
MEELTNGGLVLFENGVALEPVDPTNLIAWNRTGNHLTVVVRRQGAAHTIAQAVRVPVIPGNEEAPTILASWIPQKPLPL